MEQAIIHIKRGLSLVFHYQSMKEIALWSEPLALYDGKTQTRSLTEMDGQPAPSSSGVVAAPSERFLPLTPFPCLSDTLRCTL